MICFYLFSKKKLALLLKNALLLILLLFNVSAYAQDDNGKEKNGDDSNYRIGLTTGSFVPKKTSVDNFTVLPTDLFDHKYFRLIQFYQIPSEEQRKTWSLNGLYLTDYLPGSVYFAVIESDFIISEISAIVRAILPVDKRFKMEAPLYFKGIPKHALRGGSIASMTLSYYTVLNHELVISDLRARGVVIEKQNNYSGQLVVSFDASRLEEITMLPYIQFVGAIPDEPSLEESDFRNSSGRSNYINTGFNELNFNGEGIAVAIGESGALVDELDVKGRITELTSGYSSHKIDVMKSCAGAGNEDPANRNNAWGANVVSEVSYPDYVSIYNDNDVRYTNHSYGIGTTPSGDYDAIARAHDIRISSYPNHLVIYSSGNSGAQTGYAPYAFPTWATITGAMKMNKNMLSVGALLPTDELASFSSTGPMYDGRIIPQVVIEGNEGTSLAAPKTTGIFAMLNHVYQSKNSGNEPASSLLRAIVMNTADDIGNPGPDFKSGYGRINVRRAYNLINDVHYLSGIVTNGATNTHTLNIPANTKQLRVMIVWPDVAAVVNANPGIVNDLNLVAIDPGNTSYNTWVLDASLPSSEVKLNAPAIRGVDNLNTIEQVTVDNPQTGNWTIQINGYNVPLGPQSYYLTYEYLMDELHFLFPLKEHKLQSGTIYDLRWDSYGGTGTFTIDYQIDSGNWVNIVSNHDALSRTYKWVAPTLSGIHTIKFRIKRGSLTAESDINYIGPVPENFRIDKVCNDQVTLKWSSVNGANSYKVYRLGAKYMEEVTANITFDGNSAVLTGQSTTYSEYYAVSALTNTYEGLRTLTIEKAAGDYNCISISWTGANSADWFDIGNWSTASLPTCNDNVFISSTSPNQPSINSSGAVCRNIVIEIGATLTMSGATAYTLSICGDWTNNGTFIRGIGTVDFVGINNYQEIAGTSTTNFYILNVSKGTINQTLEVTSLITLNASTNPLVINSGTFKLSSASTITPFTNGANAELNSNKCLWNNGGTINYGNFLWYNGGILRLSAGTINSGIATNNHIVYWNSGRFIIEGGVLNVAGAIRPNSGTSIGYYTQHGGTVTVCTSGSTNIDRGAFEINSGVPFTMSGGSIVVRRASSNATADVIISSSTSVVTGGTLQIGDTSTPANQTIRVNSVVPVFNIMVNNTNSPTARLVTNNLTVKNNVNITGGTLNSYSMNISLGGNWSNSGTFTAGTGTVTFNGATAQTLSGSAASIFNDLTLNNLTGLILSGSTNTTVNGMLTLTSGVISTGNNKIAIGNTGNVNRTSGHIFGNLQKYIPTGTSVVGTFEIGDASVDNYTPISFSIASVNSAGNLTAKTISGDHPNIGSSTLGVSRSVNRYWSVTNTGVLFTNYDATFSFLTNDVDALTNTSSLVCGKFDNPDWTYPTVGIKTATTTQITGVTSFSDFQLAEEGCIDPDVPEVLASFSTICVGDNSTISISEGNLNGATSWVWYSGSCGGTPVGSGTSIIVSPSENTTYYVRGEGGCVIPGACANIEISVTTQVTPTFAPVGPYCEGASIPALPLTSTNGITGTWSPSIDNTTTTEYTFNPTAGQCATTATLTITITPTTTPNTTTITACDSYTWSVNSTVYNASGIYTSVNGCDTEILNLTIIESTSNTTTITACGSYEWSENSTVYTVSGTYTSVTGCHTETLILTIVGSTSNTTTVAACDSYTWSVNSAVYNASGTYTSITGCHTEILILTIVGSTSNTTTITACDSYEWSENSTIYTSSGTYTSVTGCHTEILVLTIVASTSNTTTITACDSYTWSVNSTVYTASGTYTSVTGCHTETLILTIVASTSNTTTITACDSYTWSENSTTYNASGNYTSVTGCHTEILILTIVASTSNTTTITACDSYVWDVNGMTYTASDTYTYVTGCHTEILVLTITDNTSNTTTITACDSYEWSENSTVYTASGTYTSVTGCHTEILNLTIVASTSNTTTITACDSYEWSENSTVYTASGTYTIETGCHTEILILTIVSSTSNTTTITACDSYFWSVNGTTYNASGTFTFVNGCVTEILSLTIVGSSSNSTTISACGSYLWDVNGETYNSSGTYTSVTGCHTEILLLTIIPNTSNTTTITACNSYLWDVNGTTYTASDTYTHVTGCHTEILILTIITSTSTTTTISTCGSYFWSVNGSTYTETGVYTSVTGCHTQILNLTITGPCPDCLGEPGGPAQPGTACDDGDPDTTDDVFGNDCICAGTPPNSLCNIGATLNGNQSVCAGGVLGLVATGGNQYQWSGPNGFNQPNGGAISRSPANMNMSGTYTVTITNNTCVDVLSIIVTVYPIPSATLSGTSSICSGGTITLNAPVGAVSYQWSGPGGFSTNTGSLNTLTRTNVNTTMAGLYKVTVTNAGGCTASASRNVSVGAPATANVTGATSVCGNANVVLTATTAGVAYSWTGTGGFTATTAAISTPALAGQYKVTVTSAAGCISTATKTITVTAAPNASIIGNANICTGGTIYLLASGGNSYSWSGPSGYTKTGSTLSRSGATVAMSGTYTVTVIGSGGCTATASILVTVAPCGSKTTGNEMVTESLTAYPNPTDGETTIAFTAHTAEQITLSVYAVDGREVAILFNELTKADTTYEFALDMNHLPSGTYYAMLRHANGATEQVRVMVVR